MNAIILAAGMGTRMRPLTNHIPKCLVKVGATSFIENQITLLHEAGIYDICLVSGYCADELDFLKEKEGVEIIYNPHYDTINNIYSMYLVKERLGDTYILEGDVYIHKNIFTRDINESTYFASRRDCCREWALITDENGYLNEVRLDAVGNGLTMSGISYWTKADGKVIRQEIERLIKTSDFQDLFWDNAVLSVMSSMSIRVQEVEGVYEIDTVDELRQLENRFNNSI